MDNYTDLIIPQNPEKEFRISRGKNFIGIFKNVVTLLWGGNFSTSREISDLTPEQLKSFLSGKGLWVIFDQEGKAIGVSKNI